jgi:hypothetical protein
MSYHLGTYHPMTYFSLGVNILVLIPVCIGLLTDAGWSRASYGDAAPARSILLAIYLAILSVSAMLLFYRDPKFAASMFIVQIIDKVLTPITVGTWSNPVVISNLFIAFTHVITLVFMGRKTFLMD